MFLPSSLDPHFWDNAATPAPRLCAVWAAWGSLLAAAAAAPTSGLDVHGAPFVYDLTNTGREVLAQLTTPLALAFDAQLYAAGGVDPSRLSAAGAAYSGLLRDLDAVYG